MKTASRAALKALEHAEKAVEAAQLADEAADGVADGAADNGADASASDTAAIDERNLGREPYVLLDREDKDGNWERIPLRVKPSDAVEETIGQKWGGGYYKATLIGPSKAPKDKGRFTTLRRWEMRLAKVESETPDLPKGPMSFDGMMMTRMLEMSSMMQQQMIQSQQSHQAMLQLLLNTAKPAPLPPPPPPPPDPAVGLAAMMTALGTIMPKAADPAALLVPVLVKALEGKRDEKSPISEFTEIFKLANSVANGRLPGEEGDDGEADWVKALKYGAPAVKSIVEAALQPKSIPPAPSSPAVVVPRLEPVRSPDGSTTMTPPETPDGMPMLAVLDAWVPWLVRKAERGKRTDDAAATFLSELSENQQDELLTAIREPQALELLVGRYPAIQPHLDWFRRVLDELARLSREVPT